MEVKKMKEMMTKEKWYYSSYSAKDNNGEKLFPDGDYFIANSDEEAIEKANEFADNGTDFGDIGHVEMELISVCRVDPENEWEETETIWY